MSGIPTLRRLVVFLWGRGYDSPNKWPRRCYVWAYSRNVYVVSGCIFLGDRGDIQLVDDPERLSDWLLFDDLASDQVSADNKVNARHPILDGVLFLDINRDFSRC